MIGYNFGVNIDRKMPMSANKQIIFVFSELKTVLLGLDRFCVGRLLFVNVFPLE